MVESKLKVIKIVGIFIITLITLTSYLQVYAYPIQTFDASISSKKIIRGSIVDIYATVANMGDKEFDVVSLNAYFQHYQNISRFDKTYTVKFDYDHRTVKPNETLTGTLRAKITNAEAKYNVTIYFVIEDTYNSTSVEGENVAPARNFYVATNITVEVIEVATPSEVVLGIGLTFTALVGIMALYIIFNWLKEKLKKRKY